MKSAIVENCGTGIQVESEQPGLRESLVSGEWKIAKCILFQGNSPAIFRFPLGCRAENLAVHFPLSTFHFPLGCRAEMRAVNFLLGICSFLFRRFFRLLGKAAFSEAAGTSAFCAGRKLEFDLSDLRELQLGVKFLSRSGGDEFLDQIGGFSP